MKQVLVLFFYFLYLYNWGQASPSSASIQASEMLSPMQLQLEVAQPSKTDKTLLALITLCNKNASIVITDIDVQIMAGDTILTTSQVAKLEGGQAWAGSFRIPSTEGNSYLFVKYKYNNQDHSLARAILHPTSAKKDTIWPTLIPVISSLVGAILGAWLLNYYTSQRERSRARFEWSKMLFEKYELAYRDFLRGWANSPIPLVLETQFNALQDNSLVPPSIITAYNGTFALLSDDNVSDLEKQKACDRLRESVDHFMREPWYSD
jgi:hypothetical protein